MPIKVILLSAFFLAGCSYFPYYNEDEDRPLPPVTVQPQAFDVQNLYMTQAYEIAATRATNRMLDDTSDFYETQPTPKLYVKQIIKGSPNLPDGFHTAYHAIKEIAGKSGTYSLVKDMNEADYLLDSRIEEFNSAGLPAIIFKLTINDKSDHPLKAWNVVIRQMSEDQSWQ